MKKLVIQSRFSSLLDRVYKITFVTLGIFILVAGALIIANLYFPGASKNTNPSQYTTSAPNPSQYANIDLEPVVLDLSNIAQNLKDACGNVSVIDSVTHLDSNASGFVISSDGLVVTNYHVIEAANSGTFTMEDATTNELKSYKILEVVNYSHTYDMAIIKIDASNLPALRMGDSSKVKSGDALRIIGVPEGKIENINTLIEGRVLGPIARYGYEAIESDAQTMGGVSGSPVINDQDLVVALHSGTNTLSKTAVHIPINFIKPLLAHNLHVSLQTVYDRRLYTSRMDVGFDDDPIALYDINSSGFAFRLTKDNEKLLWEHARSQNEQNEYLNVSEGYAIYDDFENQDVLLFKQKGINTGLIDYLNGYYLYGNVDFMTNSKNQKVVVPAGGDVMTYDKKSQVLRLSYKSKGSFVTNGQSLMLEPSADLVSIGQYSQSKSHGGSVIFNYKNNTATIRAYNHDVHVGQALRVDLKTGATELETLAADNTSTWQPGPSDLVTWTHDAGQNQSVLTINNDLACQITVDDKGQWTLENKRFVCASVGVGSRFGAGSGAESGSGVGTGSGAIEVRALDDAGQPTVWGLLQGQTLLCHTQGNFNASAGIDEDGLTLGEWAPRAYTGGEAAKDASGLAIFGFNNKGCQLTDGYLYVGELDRGLPNAYGLLFNKEKENLYRGQLKEGLPMGFGGLFTKNFYAYFGIWKGYDLVQPYTYEFYENR